jgi:NADH:ubiquinone oxidoreductase subunit H
MYMVILLAEYMHLVISAIHFLIFFIGGWSSFEFVMLLPPLFSSYHHVNSFSVIF